ncbi:MAG: hypothetical protein KDD11_23825, partial [Acidobacteria bacterium]|nr:hypothetical protein [Acidobacteriota bacterium]
PREVFPLRRLALLLAESGVLTLAHRIPFRKSLGGHAGDPASLPQSRARGGRKPASGPTP